MKNRDRLRHTALYDLLMDMNTGICAYDYMCVKEVLTDEYQYTDHDRCIMRAHDCGECLRKWLNEEERSGIAEPQGK